MKKDTSGPAFPLHPGMANVLGCIHSETDCGMSLRDYFAAKAMQVYLQDVLTDEREIDKGISVYAGTRPASDTAEMAYLMADAMLEARKK